MDLPGVAPRSHGDRTLLACCIVYAAGRYVRVAGADVQMVVGSAGEVVYGHVVHHSLVKAWIHVDGKLPGTWL